jgi:hypothetical protein
LKRQGKTRISPTNITEKGTKENKVQILYEGLLAEHDEYKSSDGKP